MSQFTISVSKKYNFIFLQLKLVSISNPNSACMEHGIGSILACLKQSWGIPSPWGFVQKARLKTFNVRPTNIYVSISSFLSLLFQGTLMKGIYEKPRANILLNSERQNAFSLRPGGRQRCPLPPVLLNIVLEVLARASSQVNEKSSRLESKKQNYLYLQMI